ncbi:hypothetical protein MHU86_11783 [Fragilaria crotonensis]|nr:hypothetical protein MHU86_11783 [Fragilaria crotonensis]
MPTICFNLTNANKKLKKKVYSAFLEPKMEPPVIISTDVNIPAATITHPNLYKTCSKRAKQGKTKTMMKKKHSTNPAAKTTYESDPDDAAYVTEPGRAETPSTLCFLLVPPKLHQELQP